jgi:hypothetical protein
MAGDRERGEMFLRNELLGEKQASLDGMTAKGELVGDSGYGAREDTRKMQASFWKFLKISVFLLACGVALFGSALLFPPRSLSPGAAPARANLARSAAPQEASTATVSSSATSFSTSSASPTSTTPVQVFQVFSPVLGPGGLLGSNGVVPNTTTSTDTSGTSCQVTLMVHSFNNSFGKPFVGMLSKDLLMEHCTNERSRKL